MDKNKLLISLAIVIISLVVDIIWLALLSKDKWNGQKDNNIYLQRALEVKIPIDRFVIVFTYFMVINKVRLFYKYS